MRSTLCLPTLVVLLSCARSPEAGSSEHGDNGTADGAEMESRRTADMADSASDLLEGEAGAESRWTDSRVGDGTAVDAEADGMAGEAGALEDAGKLDDGSGQDGSSDASGFEETADAAAPDCPAPAPMDYSCDDKNPMETCPGGYCLAGMCIGPVLDEDPWKDCADGACMPCESAAKCPVDCGAAPEKTGEKEYDNGTTITVWVHGFYNKSPDEMADDVYGKDGGCGGVLDMAPSFGVTRPCGNTPAGGTAPNQFARVEYYGGVPDSWLTAGDIAEIEQYPYEGGPLGLQRYGLVVAKFIRHKLDVSSATHVNLACHSMGCLICRYMIENNIENLAAENRIVRWFTSNGVLAGARLARLFDNPSVQAGAQALGLELSDFILMNPDYVQATACWWDHKLTEGNNPLFSGMLIHHACATDPKIAEAFGIQLLDLDNPGAEPNDGIMYTFDEFFHSQYGAAAFITPNGDIIESTHTYGYFDHMTLPETEGAGLLATAGLFHSRKVVVKLAQIELLDDREADNLFDSEHGTAPADVSWSVKVRYNPYVLETYGKNVLVHEDKPDHRSAPLFQQSQGQILVPGLVLFSGPVLDGMEALHLDFDLLEMDWYPRFGVGEWVFDPDQSLATYVGGIPLQDGVIDVVSEYAKLKLEVRVYQMY